MERDTHPEVKLLEALKEIAQEDQRWVAVRGEYQAGRLSGIARAAITAYEAQAVQAGVARDDK